MSGLDAPRVLVIDDEPQIHRFLAPALSASGYAPLRAETGAEGLKRAAEGAPALILLDLGLPDMDGKALIPRLRGFTAAPIVILSAREQEAEKVAALDAGADDYVEKPFALAELLARMRAVLRRGGRPAPAAPVVRSGPLEVDFARRTARLEGQPPLKLTPREWDLLAALARAGEGRVITQRQLLTAVWGPAHLEDAQYLRVYIGHLRQKLGPAAGLIRTEPGIGYRFGPAEEEAG
ncbi:response regulator transcription factor [Siccirubricoccus sp. KC 17139]|uniref:Response regulator transcription factor n=1 Tax=Siccirubricoccus soli TaxID=2899147 RepID=A0ABT1D7G7_9PROT|nr:response regulator transcription factor [Siccirubricoccus soli]MCO6417882.1 response regulator transcription factor [Siccirubricoccus soli]MCP2684017.1 response regulator transcription factor [Siccirubricoccus soli]